MYYQHFYLAQTSGEVLLQQGRDVQDLLTAQFDQMWTSVIGGPLYRAIADLGATIALMLLGFWVVKWIKAWINDESNQALGEIVFPLVIVMMLRGNGALLGTTTLAMRDVVNQLNRDILVNVSSGISLQEQFNELQTQFTAGSTLQGLQAQCESFADLEDKQLCLDAVAAEAQQLETDLAPEEDSFLGGIINDVTSGVVGALNSTIEFILRGWLMAMGVAFQYLIEISLLLTGLVGPIALGASLTPLGYRSFMTWIVGFFTVGLVKTNYNIIIGLVAQIMNETAAGDPLIFGCIVGILAPVLAVAIGTLGGFSIFQSLAAAGSFAIGSLPASGRQVFRGAKGSANLARGMAASVAQRRAKAGNR